MGVGVLSPTALPTNSQIRGFDKKLRMKSLLEDIYEDLKGMYSNETKEIPNAIRMEVSEKEKAQSNNVTITMVMRLKGMGVYDPNPAIGQEERPETRTFTIYRNIVRKVVTTPGYGPDDLDARPYGLYENFVGQLAIWNKEHKGLSLRQAILEQYGESLVHGRTLGVSQRNWSPNLLVCGLDRTQMQVAYNTNRATFSTNIINRILTSGGGSLNQLVSQTLNMPNLSNAQNLAIENRITKLKLPGLPGGMGWILTISELQAVYLGDPAFSTRNMGHFYVEKAALPETVQNWRGVLGKYKSFLIVEDVRQPTLKISGTSAPYGLTAGYVYPGDDNDDRDRNEVYTRDTAFIEGKAAVVDWTAMPLRHIRQSDDYGMIQGHGTAVVEGCAMPIYDQQNPEVGTHEQYSSMVLVCGLPSYV
jgi:hypothetical protein